MSARTSQDKSINRFLLNRFGLPALAMAAFLLAAPAGLALAQGNSGDNPGQGHGRPGVEFDEEMSPLQKEIQASVDRKKDKEEKENPACLSAMENGDQDKIDKVCKFPRVNMRKLDETECPSCGDMVNPQGKVVGKRIKTETRLRYFEPGQKAPGAVKWDKVKFSSRQLGEVGNGLLSGAGLGLGQGVGRGPKVRQAALFPDSASNDDKDCLDRVTGEVLGGYVDDQAEAVPANLIPDGAAGSCYQADGSLKQTLTAAPGGCLHSNGTFVAGDPLDGVEDTCYDEAGNLRTSLEELIDEDGPETIDNDSDGLTDEDPEGDADGDGNPNDDMDCMNADGLVLRDMECFDAQGALLDGLAELVDEDGPDAIDQDGDGRTDEDPPAAAMADACLNFGMQQGLKAGLGDMVGEECDLTRAVIASVNQRVMALHGQKFYMADEDGNLDTTGGGAVEFGLEQREIRLQETLTYKCENPDAELVDGQCVAPAAAPAGIQGNVAGAAAASAAVLETEPGVPNPPPATVKEQVMMGFTFAPPVLEWGYRVEEYACVDLPLVGDVCVEVFFARIGYEFDMAVGLRFPMEVEVTEIPNPNVLAGSERTFKTTIQPLDFTAKQYKDFCEKHQLANGRGIADCERFSFPSWLSLLNPLADEDEIDGDEFVARLVVFAGVKVRVALVPVISWGIDSAVDLPTMCTMLQLKDNNFNLLNFGLDLANDRTALEAFKNQLVNCASFTTPFGLEPDPESPLGQKRLRALPVAKSFDIRADCAEALVRGETITIKKKTRPLCTNLLLGTNGASLGIGLGVEAALGSTLVKADWSAGGDGIADTGSTTLEYRHSADEGEPALDLGPMVFDNYAADGDANEGVVTLDDFVYYLNTIQLRLRARFQFGGILSPIPDLGAFSLFNFRFGLDNTGIPIPQHAGTEGIAIRVPVSNHAVAVDVSAPAGAPGAVNADTLEIRPGEAGTFQVAVENLGNVFGDFDNFRYTLSNRPNQTAPYSFGINPNTDHDCTDGTSHFRGDPYNGVADECFTAAGAVRSDRTELIDEDPPGPAGAPASVRDEDGDGLVDEDPVDDWQATPAPAAFAAQRIDAVPGYTRSTDSPGSPVQTLDFSVSPFRHPLTRPGLYPFLIQADSLDARALGMEAEDPVGNRRLDASDIGFIQVSSFFQPDVDVRPVAPVVQPGVAASYSVTGANVGNDIDSMSVTPTFVDFNQAGCNLATLGSIPDQGSGPACPFRAYPTVIQAAAAGAGSGDWTDVASLATSFGPLMPLETALDGLRILVPADWAGMQDTTYQFIVEVVSSGDPASPAASDSVVITHTVTATKESMVRFINLELDALIAEIEAADAAGVPTGGLLPLLMRPVRMMNRDALGAVLDGDFGTADNKMRSAVKVMEGFVHALDSAESNLTAEMAADWQQRAAAILADLPPAIASGIPSAASSVAVASGN